MYGVMRLGGCPSKYTKKKNLHEKDQLLHKPWTSFKGIKNMCNKFHLINLQTPSLIVYLFKENIKEKF